jgi:anti-sigma regulatory factor (Ser/Thr protein kinase)
VLALSEAVTRAAEHAYRDRPHGMIEHQGGIELAPDGQHRVMLTVRDHGRWRAPSIDDGDRGQGIALMRACIDTVTITEPEDRKGTQVILRSQATRRPAEVANEGS